MINTGGVDQRTRAAAHEVMVLDYVATGSNPTAFAIDPAQWMADDLRGRQEER